jgi:hypothetical protein
VAFSLGTKPSARASTDKGETAERSDASGGNYCFGENFQPWSVLKNGRVIQGAS